MKTLTHLPIIAGLLAGLTADCDGCSSEAESVPTPSAPTTEQPMIGDAEDAPAESYSVEDFEVSVDENLYTVTHDGRSARLRYSESLREQDGEFNYPRVAASFELEVDGEWQPLQDVECHDSFDDCGAPADSGYSCAVVESSRARATWMRTLHETLELSPTPALIDAVGAKTPIRACMATLNRFHPDQLVRPMEDAFSSDGPIDGDVLEAFAARVEGLTDVWNEDRERAAAMLEELGERHGRDELGDDPFFQMRYELARMRATTAGRYDQPPFVTAGGALVEDDSGGQ